MERLAEIIEHDGASSAALVALAEHRQREETEARKLLHRRTVIYDVVRDELDVTNNEYALLEKIDRLSGPKSPLRGWCTAAKSTLAKMSGLKTRSTVHRIVNRLLDRGLVEVQAGTGYLRPTGAWYRAVEQVRTSSGEAQA